MFLTAGRNRGRGLADGDAPSVAVIVVGIDDLAEIVGEEADRALMIGVVGVAPDEAARRVERLHLQGLVDLRAMDVARREPPAGAVHREVERPVRPVRDDREIVRAGGEDARPPPERVMAVALDDDPVAADLDQFVERVIDIVPRRQREKLRRLRDEVPVGVVGVAVKIVVPEPVRRVGLMRGGEMRGRAVAFCAEGIILVVRRRRRRRDIGQPLKLVIGVIARPRGKTRLRDRGDVPARRIGVGKIVEGQARGLTDRCFLPEANCRAN